MENIKSLETAVKESATFNAEAYAAEVDKFIFAEATVEALLVNGAMIGDSVTKRDLAALIDLFEETAEAAL